jgi:hypothetical protein
MVLVMTYWWHAQWPSGWSRLKSTLTNFNLKLCSHAVSAFKICSHCLGAAVIGLKGVLNIGIEMCSTKLSSVKMSLDLHGSIFWSITRSPSQLKLVDVAGRCQIQQPVFVDSKITVQKQIGQKKIRVTWDLLQFCFDVWYLVTAEILMPCMRCLLTPHA